MSNRNNDQIRAWINRTVIDPSGKKVGTVADVHIDDNSDPDWLTVSTGMFGTRRSFIPVEAARLEEESVITTYDKDIITDAPRAVPDDTLSAGEEQRLYEY